MRSLSVFVVTFVLLHSNKSDLIEQFGCHDTEFRLSCKSLTASIAIFKATFSATPLKFSHASCQPSNQSIDPNDCNTCPTNNCGSENSFGNNSRNVGEVNFRHAINRRCSGVNYCSFVFKEDFDEAGNFGAGEIFLRYACAEDSTVAKSCNSNVNASNEGFARTPGYPSYYVGETTCRWTLKAPSTQRVRVTFLDISIRPVAPHESDCIDWIDVFENGLNLFSSCGDVDEDIVIYSQGSALNVSFVTLSKKIFPKRGVLFHYKAVGCPSLRKPEGGYLIDKNESFVHYRCCIGFVFPDTFSRDKILQCRNENEWNGEVLDCVGLTKLVQDEVNSTAKQNLTAEARAVMEISNPLVDIIVPCIIMAMLFLGNGIVLYVIYLQRKKFTARQNNIELEEAERKEENF